MPLVNIGWYTDKPHGLIAHCRVGARRHELGGNLGFRVQGLGFRSVGLEFMASLWVAMLYKQGSGFGCAVWERGVKA